MLDCVYLIDPETSRILWCNRSGYIELGFEKKEILNQSVLSLQKDVQGLPQWQEVRQVILDNNGYTFVGRHRHKKKGEIAIEVITTHFSYQGHLYFLSVARNINNRLALEKDMQSRNHNIWFALNEASDGIWEWELATDHVFFSPQLKKMLGYGPDEMPPTLESWSNNVHPEDIDRVITTLKDHIQGRRSQYEAEYRLLNRNGHVVWVHDQGKVCERDDKGNPTHVAGMVQDITERKQLEEQLQRLASHDALTQLPNRRAGEEHAAYLLAMAKRKQTPLTFAVIDFDNFKEVNDIYGHQKGDEVLILITQVLRESLRGSDYLYRWGGEEFVILLPETELDNSLIVTNKWHQTLKQINWAEHNLSPVTISIGLSAYPTHGDTPFQLFQSADRAVYEAKAKGRNQTLIAKA
ncbi:diguanylate cyclase [Hydrogenovibrio sp. SC-1]|nr:diguanylate cyclase [Hydrogenovibrio sp. SC-1]